MKTLSSRRAFTFVGDATRGPYTFAQIRRGDPCPVENYQSLAQKIAEIQYHNPEFVLFFRGQKADHLSRIGNTSILPSIYRTPFNQLIQRRKKFAELDGWARLLMARYHENRAQGDANRTRISRSKILQWAVLQHYELCKTPLLDVTQSLRIACSFAAEEDDNSPNKAFLMVLALPQIHGSVSVCAASEIQIIRLASICPPHFTRPHIQEGFALTEYPDPASHDSRGSHEFDFGKRLIAKFSFHPQTFWENSGASFPRMLHADLYPQNDQFLPIREAIIRDAALLPNP